jgi:hypothetical protein
MVKLIVIPSRPHHSLFFLPPLCELILGYCQYKDKKRIYKLLRLKSPQRPLIPQSVYNIYNTLNTNEEIMYIPIEKGYRLNTEFFTKIAQTQCKVYWQCNLCHKYNSIKYLCRGRNLTLFIKMVHIEKSGIKSGNYYLCKCTFKRDYFDYKIVSTSLFETNINSLVSAIDRHYQYQ